MSQEAETSQPAKVKTSKSNEMTDSFAEDHKAEFEMASGAAVDLSQYPSKIRVECSPIEKINGTYSRGGVENGKPYYTSAGRKTVQLFAHNKDWKFGNITKPGFYAKVKADRGYTLPTEPYPFAWKVVAKKDEAQKLPSQDAPAMRVIDLDLEVPSEANLPAQPAEKGVSLLLDAHTKRLSKRRRKTGDLAPGDSVAAKKTKEGELTNREGVVETKAKSEESSDESGSESDSESSSSSSGSDKSSGTAPSPKAKVMTVMEIEAPKEVVHDPKKATAFEEKLRLALNKATTKDARSKLRLITGNPQQYTKVSTMTRDDLMAFCDRMYKEYGKPVPKPPPGQPPRHLFEKAGLQVPDQLYAEVTASTSTETENLMPHRNPNEREPKRGCIRKVNLGKFHPEAKRISFHNNGSGDQSSAEVPRCEIDSMRKYLTHLWFQQPGAMVNCDYCGQEVPQTCGCLQGAQGSSQFAQNTFVCQSCM